MTSSEKPPYIKAGIGILAVTAIGKLSVFAIDILLANKLQPTAYGIVAILLSISQIAIIFSNFGISPSLIRFLPPSIKQRDYQKVTGIVKNALIITTFFSLLVFALSSLIIYLFPEYTYPDINREFVLFGVILGILISFSKTVGAYFQSIKKPVLGHAYSENIYPIVSLLLLTVLILSSSLTWMKAIYCLLFAATIVLLFGAFSMKASVAQFKTGISFDTKNSSNEQDYKFLQNYALTGMIIAIGFLGLRVTDKLMLGAMTTMQDVGIYALSNRLSLIITLVVFLFPPILGPYIARNYGEGTHKALDAYLITSRWTYLITVPIVLTLFFYSQEILVFLGGEGYAGGSTVLKFLAISSFLVAATGNNGLLLQMSGKEKTDRNNVILALLLDIVLNYALIPDYQVVGAAVATFTALLLTTFLKTYQVWRYWQIIPFGIGQTKGLIAGCLWISTYLLLKNFDVYFILSAFISSSVYLASLAVLGLTPDDKKIFKMIAMKIKRA